jgi:hypothetical protein
MYIPLFSEDSPLTVEAPFNESSLQYKCDLRYLCDCGKPRDNSDGYTQEKKKSFPFKQSWKWELMRVDAVNFVPQRFILRKPFPVPEGLSSQRHVQEQIHRPTFQQLPFIVGWSFYLPILSEQQCDFISVTDNICIECKSLF